MLCLSVARFSEHEDLQQIVQEAPAKRGGPDVLVVALDETAAFRFVQRWQHHHQWQTGALFE